MVSSADRKEVNEWMQELLSCFEDKFNGDLRIILRKNGVVNANDVIPLSNRQTESVFGVLKSIEKRMMNLTPAHLTESSKALSNSLTQWLLSIPAEEAISHVKKAKKNRRSIDTMNRLTENERIEQNRRSLTFNN